MNAEKEALKLTLQKYKGSSDSFEQFYAKKFDNLEEIEKFLHKQTLSRLN